MTNDEQILREKVWEILNTIQANQLYVHSSTLEVPINLNDIDDKKTAILLDNVDFLEKVRKYDSKINTSKKKDEEETGKKKRKKSSRSKSRKKKRDLQTVYLPEILTISILNALVPNSAMLLIGGHGGGKSTLVKHLGRMFTGMPLIDTEDCIIRGHSQLTEEKMIATLNVAKLMKQGEEEVRWRTFTTSFWKVLDEVNRLSPYAQNILLSMLAEGKVKYYDSVYPVDKYVLYGTLNPGGVGTFDMAPPFLDRFGISVNISMPTTHDLSIILGSRDDKLLGYDEIMQVPAILNVEQLLSIWYKVDKVKINKTAENFIHSIIREFTLCERIDKGNSQYLTPETGLCNECHFNLKKLVCNKVVSILSVRVAKDLLRYSKALAWLIGFNRVTIDIIKAIAPYVISHRVKYVERELNDAPYWGNKLRYTQELVEKAHLRFINREHCYEIIDKFRDGDGTDEDIVYLKGYKGSDLITAVDLLPIAESLNNSDYKKTIKLIEKFNETQKLDKLVEFNELLSKNLNFPNRGELINKINKYMRELTYWSREFTFKRWDIIRHSIASVYASFSGPLEETTKKQCTRQLRSKNIFLEINVTGTEPNSKVQINCHGGKEAIELQNILEESYPVKSYDFDAEIGDLDLSTSPPIPSSTSIKINNPPLAKTSTSSELKKVAKRRDDVDEASDLLDEMFPDD